MFDYHRELDIGDQRAENDWAFLGPHFITIGTSACVETERTAIILGRKGSGKSALRMHFERTAENGRIAITIQPAAEDLRDMFEQVLNQEVPLFSVETISQIWAICVYANVVRSCLPVSSRGPTRGSKLLRRLLGVGQERIALHHVLVALRSSGVSSEGIGVFLDELKELSEKCLREAEEHFYILIDSVDEAMHNVLDTTLRTDLFATFFEGLLSFARDFTNVERNTSASKVHLKLFIPLDVYDWSVARHADHLRGYKNYIDWNERELFELIVGRLEDNLDKKDTQHLRRLSGQERQEEIWKLFFPSRIHLDYYSLGGTFVRSTPTKEFLIKMTLRRPRDLMEIVRQVYVETRNQRLSFPNEDSMFRAIQAYSYELRSTVETEYENVLPEINQILSSFSGNLVVFQRNTLEELVGRCLDHKPAGVDRALNILYQACVIGVVEGGFDPRYPEREREHKFYYDLPNWGAVQNEAAYVIHRAFWHSLQLKSLRHGRSSYGG